MLITLLFITSKFWIETGAVLKFSQIFDLICYWILSENNWRYFTLAWQKVMLCKRYVDCLNCENKTVQQSYCKISKTHLLYNILLRYTVLNKQIWLFGYNAFNYFFYSEAGIRNLFFI